MIHQNILNQPLSFEIHYRRVCDLLLSLTRSRSLPKGLQLHAHILKSRLETIPLISHHLINFYSKCQLPFCALLTFDETLHKTVTTWSSIISAFAQNELPWFAIEFFRRMVGENLRPDDHVFPSATKSCAILGRTDIGKSIHSFALKTGFDNDVFVGSSLVDMYSKCGETRLGRKLFDEMPERNVVSWSGMIYGYAQMGEDEEALGLFKLALLDGLDVNDFTFSSVIRVCASSTLLELGKQIQGLCLKTSFDSTSHVGCRIHGNTELATYAADKVFELGPVSPGLHVLLANAYAAAGRYEDAAKARKLLRDRGMKKETGLSWIILSLPLYWIGVNGCEGECACA
ncbi:hypothetical protein SAY86_019032 [Trapa natans]|uniref:Pentatricopeptide repeat-containing protein n=1 Tax=Trapa natans TaxID=22666 RepID=A0AAN7LHZ7_TRANT|nr:hypothetical protein SAY86_019032 [Trapa natans]